MPLSEGRQVIMSIVFGYDLKIGVLLSFYVLAQWWDLEHSSDLDIETLHWQLIMVKDIKKSKQTNKQWCGFYPGGIGCCTA